MNRTHRNKVIGVIAFILTLTIIFEVSGLRENFNLEYLRLVIEENIFIGSMIFIAMFAVGNLIQIPGWLFLMAAVITLGKVSGGAITYIAAVSSCLMTYFVIGFLGQDALRSIENPMAKRLFDRLDDSPVSSIIMLRTVFQTAPVLNYTLALSGIKFRHYFIGTLIGMPLPIILYCLGFEVLAEFLIDSPN